MLTADVKYEHFQSFLILNVYLQIFRVNGSIACNVPAFPYNTIITLVFKQPCYFLRYHNVWMTCLLIFPVNYVPPQTLLICLYHCSQACVLILINVTITTIRLRTSTSIFYIPNISILYNNNS